MASASAVRKSRELRRTIPRQKKNRAQEELAASLQSILSSIASLLVASGYSYGRVSKLTKVAFVNAAAAMDRDAGVKISIARIAASTGLTRTDVSLLLREGNREQQNISGRQNRAIRVAEGWMSDKDFVGPKGKPRGLPFADGKQSFANLVRRYSGDIPARAMLREMKRAKMIALDDNDLIHLVNPAAPISQKTVSAMRAISPWIDSLRASVQAAENSSLTSRTSRLNLHFDSRPQVMAALRELDERRTAFISGVAEMGNRYATESRYDLRVTIAVAAAKPLLVTHKGLRKRSEG